MLLSGTLKLHDAVSVRRIEHLQRHPGAELGIIMTISALNAKNWSNLWSLCLSFSGPLHCLHLALSAESCDQI